MNLNMEHYDKINQCPQCKKPVKVIKLAYIKGKIPGITEADLKLLKLCKTCKQKIPHA
ncbi:hypothetical protein [Alkaliphilus crotonatoxidans]